MGGARLSTIVLLILYVLPKPPPMLAAENGPNKDRRFVAASPPEDLNVTAVELNEPPRLGLFVSWTPGSGGRPAEGFTLMVHPLNKTDAMEVEGQKKYCGTFSYHQDVDEGRNSWLVSKESNREDALLEVLPECSYGVRLYASPYDGKSRLEVQYTVPRCVGGVCSCRLAGLMPRANLGFPAPLPDRRYNLSWNVQEASGAELEGAHFIIGVGPEVLRPHDHRPVIYDLRTLPSVPWRGPGDYWAVFTPKISTKVKVHEARVSLRNHWGCQGPWANRTFQLSELLPPPEDATTPEHDPTSPPRHQVLLHLLLPCAALAVVAILGLGLVLQRWGPWAWLRRKARWGHALQPVKSWRRVYRAVSRDSSRYTTAPSAEERNVLYVEQEIQEALERGEADGYEVNYNRLHLGRQIGRGAFGRVFLARIDAVGGTPVRHTIAVKKLKQIATLKQVGRHPHVVSLVGCCTIRQPYCMLMEWVPCGDLLRYLRRLRAELKRRPRPHPSSSPQQSYIDVLPAEGSDGSYVLPEETNNGGNTQQTIVPNEPCNSQGGKCCGSSEDAASEDTAPDPPPRWNLDPRELHSFALQIARGMAHLEAKQITHRDLAARNVLIDHSKTLKISDFGLSRSGIYVNTKRRKVPLRWLSIEAMRDHLYSSRSDVWAYGVVLWEIGTLGGFPYPTVPDLELISFVLQGGRLEKPTNCTDDLYALMSRCWHEDADSRPTFAALCAALEVSLGRKNVYVDFASLPEIDLPPTENIHSQ